MRKIAVSFLGVASLFATEAVAQPYPPSPYLFLNQAHTWGAPQTFTSGASLLNGLSVDKLAVSGMNLSDTFTWVGGINNISGGGSNYQTGGVNGFVRVNGTLASANQFTYFNELWYQDSLNAVGGAGALVITDQLVPGFVGARSVLTTQEYITYVPAVTGDYEFSSGEFYATASVNTGGTSGAPKSTLYGINPNVQLGSGATNWVEIIGEELDIAVNTGASVNSLIGLEIGLSPNHAVRGTQDDVGLLISGSQQAVGLTVGIALGTPGKPTAFDSLSTLIRASPGVVNPSGLTVTNGIDFGSGMTFTGNTWNDGHIIFTGSGGIRVNGSSGVSCSGSPTSGFLSVNGIVTHC